MNRFEQLENEAYNSGIDIINYSFNSPNIKGLYCDGTVGISDKLETNTEKRCVLAEEMGHHKTSHGDIIDLHSTTNTQQELKARLWGYNKIIGLDGLIKAFENHCQNIYETAEFLDVTPEYLLEALKTYQSKYGNFLNFNNYLIQFNYPNILITKF